MLLSYLVLLFTAIIGFFGMLSIGFYNTSTGSGVLIVLVISLIVFIASFLATMVTNIMMLVGLSKNFENLGFMFVLMFFISQVIDRIMSCGYQAGNGIVMTTNQCGCHVISLADCVNVVEYIYATSGSSVPFISFCIEEVDISRPWCIEEYDGAEGIKYLDAYKCVDMFIHFCPCPYLLNINL